MVFFLGVVVLNRIITAKLFHKKVIVTVLSRFAKPFFGVEVLKIFFPFMEALQVSFYHSSDVGLIVGNKFFSIIVSIMLYDLPTRYRSGKALSVGVAGLLFRRNGLPIPLVSEDRCSGSV